MSNITLTGQASAPAAPGAGKFKLYIDDNGQAYVVDSGGNAVPVAPSGVDGAGGTDGQVWTADGAGGAAWESVSVPSNPSEMSMWYLFSLGAPSSKANIDSIFSNTVGRAPDITDCIIFVHGSGSTMYALYNIGTTWNGFNLSSGAFVSFA